MPPYLFITYTFIGCFYGEKIDFWLKEDIIFEQPNVDYRYQTIIQLYGTR